VVNRKLDRKGKGEAGETPQGILWEELIASSCALGGQNHKTVRTKAVKRRRLHPDPDDGSPATKERKLANVKDK